MPVASRRVLPRASGRPGWLVAVVAVLLLAVGHLPATAGTDEAITWAVSPADAEGPDDRAWVELTLDPGQTVTEHLAVTNLSDAPATFALSAADGYFTSTGRFNMLPSSEPSTAAGTWVEVTESVAVDAGATEVVPFTVTVPANVTPGDHAAGIAASIHSVGTDESGAAVGVESRVGFRVLTRVTGELDPSVAVEDLQVRYRSSWNPFTPGAVEVEHGLVNDGNVRVEVAGVVRAQGGGAPLLHEDGSAEPQELLPGDERTATAEVEGVWPFLRVGVEVVLSPEVPGEEGPQSAPEVRYEVTVWAVPWPQLIVLLAAALALVLLRRARRQRGARLDAMLAEAREEGRRQATDEDPAAPPGADLARPAGPLPPADVPPAAGGEDESTDSGRAARDGKEPPPATAR